MWVTKYTAPLNFASIFYFETMAGKSFSNLDYLHTCIFLIQIISFVQQNISVKLVSMPTPTFTSSLKNSIKSSVAISRCTADPQFLTQDSRTCKGKNTVIITVVSYIKFASQLGFLTDFISQVWPIYLLLRVPKILSLNTMSTITMMIIQLQHLPCLQWSGGPSLKQCWKTFSREDIPLERTQILASKYYQCMWCSLSPKVIIPRRDFGGGGKGSLLRKADRRLHVHDN